MPMLLRFVLSAVVLLSVPLGAAEISEEPILIHQGDIPHEITSPGHYRLAEDLLSPAEAVAITIAASEVSLDLAGHTITGPGRDADQPAFAIRANEQSRPAHITIHNGTIRDFPAGAVRLPDSHHVTIHNLHISGIGEVAIDAGDEAVIRDNHIEEIGIEDPTRTAAVVAIRAGLNSLVQGNTIRSLRHEGNGLLDGIRVGRGCYVLENRVEDVATSASGTGDVTGIACATMAADIRANEVHRVTNRRPGGMAIGVRVGSGSAEGNRVKDVSAASLAIGIQGIAAVFIERNEVDDIRAISNGPDAFGIHAAGTGGRITANTVRGIDCAGDASHNREVGIRANSAFEITKNTIQLPYVRANAHQAGIEISGIYNTLIENSIRLGEPTGPPGTAILLGPRTSANTVAGNDTMGRLINNGIGNRVPLSADGLPAL